MDNRRAQHLVRIRDRPVAVDLLEARRTVNRLGGKIPRAIECQEIVALKKRHRFQGLAVLQLLKDALKHWAERLGRHRIEDLAHLRVTRHAFNAVDRSQIPLSPLFVKGEQ